MPAESLAASGRVQVKSELERLQTLWKDLTALAGQFHSGQSCEEGGGL